MFFTHLAAYCCAVWPVILMGFLTFAKRLLRAKGILPRVTT
jgi:hypothetical protein